MTERASRPDPALQRLGATIRQYRQSQHLSQVALAARMGLRDRYLSQIELGRHNISILTLLRLAHALDVPASSLLAPLDVQASSVNSEETLNTGLAHDITSALQLDDPTVLLRVLGTNIGQYRIQRGLSQRALAMSTGLSATYINEIEQGRRNLSVLKLVRIAASLDLSVNSLLRL